ncbi:MAG: hypothetical protein KAI84_03175 [Gammaproteobacteria bacterium]|nr:hypothetical protein [Gammaproteobacteria bacterium]
MIKGLGAFLNPKSLEKMVQNAVKIKISKIPLTQICIIFFIDYDSKTPQKKYVKRFDVVGIIADSF